MSDSTHQSTPHHTNTPARGGPARQVAKVASHARIGFTLRQRSPTRRASSAVGLRERPPSLLQRLGPTFGTAVGLLLGGLAGSGTGRLIGTEVAVTSGYALGAVVGGVIGSLFAWKYLQRQQPRGRLLWATASWAEWFAVWLDFAFLSPLFEFGCLWLMLQMLLFPMPLTWRSRLIYAGFPASYLLFILLQLEAA